MTKRVQASCQIMLRNRHSKAREWSEIHRCQPEYQAHDIVGKRLQRIAIQHERKHNSWYVLENVYLTHIYSLALSNKVHVYLFFTVCKAINSIYGIPLTLVIYLYASEVT